MIYPGVLLMAIPTSLTIAAVGVRLANKVRDEDARKFWICSTMLLSFLAILMFTTIGGGFNQ